MPRLALGHLSFEWKGPAHRPREFEDTVHWPGLPSCLHLDRPRPLLRGAAYLRCSSVVESSTNNDTCCICRTLRTVISVRETVICTTRKSSWPCARADILPASVLPQKKRLGSRGYFHSCAKLVVPLQQTKNDRHESSFGHLASWLNDKGFLARRHNEPKQSEQPTALLLTSTFDRIKAEVQLLEVAGQFPVCFAVMAN